jgi:single-strand DNA-binding protein
VNRVEISGGLTRDPEIRYTNGGFPILEFTVAVSGTRYDSGERKQVVTTSYISCTVVGDRAEEFADSHGKGDEVLVLGELDQRSFEKRDGSKESKTRVSVMSVHTLRSRRPTPTHPTPDGPVDPRPAPAADYEPF